MNKILQKQSLPFIPLFAGSKTSTSRLRENEEDRWGITACKSPIGSTNYQWGMKKTPTDGSFHIDSSFGFGR